MSKNVYTHFHVETDTHGVVTVTIDVQERPMNVLTADVLFELEQIVSDIEDASGVTLVRFRSGKESGFVAGADVAVIANIASRQVATGLIDRGQRLFARIESLSMPTLAILHGPCLGGGLEWALACRYRVVRADAAAKLGLPEIKLGLIPAWGGTQRLPRVVSLTDAISMILTGKHLGANEAEKIGLVDEAIHPDQWTLRLEQLKDASHFRKNQKNLAQRIRRATESTALGTMIGCGVAQRQVRNQVEHYPALASAIRAIRAGMDPAVSGEVVERNEFTDLLATPTSKHLLSLFFARERARKISTWIHADDHADFHKASVRPIQTVGVIGAGAMGAGIALLAARRGYDVVLKEIDRAALDAGRRRIDHMVDSIAKRKRLDSGECSKIMNRLTFTCDLQTMHRCDLVIEAVVERADVKAELFGQLDGIAKPEAIFASNTSSLSIAKMADATLRPGRVAGLHFFNPVHRMELVEVIRAQQTDQATIASLLGFVKALGKTPILTSDSPGFLVNRVLFPYLGEAVRMVAEGHRVEEIDLEIRKFGMPMGPLELLDQVGIDVARHVSRSIMEVLPESKDVTEFLDAMISEGRLGKKSGLGFYRYRKGRKRHSVPIRNLVQRPALAPHDPSVSVSTRLISIMLSEATRCREESVVEHDWVVDLAMVLGTGFAPHTGGPMTMVAEMGTHRLYHSLKTLEARYGSRFAVPTRVIEKMFPPSEEVHYEQGEA